MELGTILLMVGLSYAFGVLWYDLLPGRLPEQIWRVAAYPFLGMFAGEGLYSFFLLSGDIEFGGIHLFTAAVASLLAVVADWIITQARRPAMIEAPEPRAA